MLLIFGFALKNILSMTTNTFTISVNNRRKKMNLIKVIKSLKNIFAFICKE